MVAGMRAVVDYRRRYENIKKISGMLSTPQTDVATTLSNYIADADLNRLALKAARLRIAELCAEAVEQSEKNEVFLFTDFTIPELIAFSNVANKKIFGITVALAGAEGDYKYVISSNSKDLRDLSKDINAALCGRGGGRAEMIQGSFATTLEKIKEYFK